MGIKVGALAERARSSLFLVPMGFLLAGGALALVTIEVDRDFAPSVERLPFFVTSTVDSAREVLSGVASATITVAGIAFSVALLVIQQASSQFSPRVVHSLFRDPFNRRVMGIAVGTFTYCLVALRSVRGPLEQGSDPVIPNLSVGLAVIFGVATILAIVAFIDHNAHALEVSEILKRVRNDTTKQIDRVWPEHNGEEREPAGDEPAGEGDTVSFTSSGWVQQLDYEDLLALVPAGGTVRLETAAGRYAVEGTPLCTVWPAPSDPEATRHQAAKAVQVGAARTMQQDPSYGVRQLADVALIALSPGVNDPTTAQDAIFNLAAVLREALVRDLPSAVQSDDCGRRLLRPESHNHETLVKLAFDEIRRSAAALPAVCLYLFEAIHLLHQALVDVGMADRAKPLRRQAEQLLAGAERADVLPEDLYEVRAAFRVRFGSGASALDG